MVGNYFHFAKRAYLFRPPYLKDVRLPGEQRQGRKQIGDEQIRPSPCILRIHKFLDMDLDAFCIVV